MYKYKKGVSYQFDVEGLGEFRFIFSTNSDVNKGKDKYYFESYWNPKQYGLVDFIVGYYVDDIENEVQKLSYDLDYFIDGARISCICRIEAGHDDEDVYENILNDYFDEYGEDDDEECDGTCDSCEDTICYNDDCEVWDVEDHFGQTKSEWDEEMEFRASLDPNDPADAWYFED